MTNMECPVSFSRARNLLLIVLSGLLVSDVAWPQRVAAAVSVAENGAAQITFSDGNKTVIPRERGQVSITDALIAPDGSVGWLAEFSVDGIGYPAAQELILWRAEKIVRRFSDDQSFYSWTFYAQGKQVAYHVGPLHGESKSHCELHDVASGRLITQWDGDLDSRDNRPAWTLGLSH
jgi:hypothetical protein